eukprot:CAMPEP_0177602832 /NCGR_PEP_ID=MMETSP0419_2-20121207/15130_1 /TAXON_ID=582737 /ORGANISM="Tetraselmis sp., Strain GSL018" /LENGTH=183 /DNA_ID=CAMNT_0019096445 /DNA_START=196 /DNA_END=745 /DNA_ORIENTATION=-
MRSVGGAPCCGGGRPKAASALGVSEPCGRPPPASEAIEPVAALPPETEPVVSQREPARRRGERLLVEERACPHAARVRVGGWHEPVWVQRGHQVLGAARLYEGAVVRRLERGHVILRPKVVRADQRDQDRDCAALSNGNLGLIEERDVVQGPRRVEDRSVDGRGQRRPAGPVRRLAPPPALAP